MTLNIFQKGFNYSQDGPGNRLVYHLQGCNFSCKWCSNPEGMSSKNENMTVYQVDDIVSEALRSKMMFFEGGGVTFTGGEATMQFDGLKEALIKLKENNIHTAVETNGSHKHLKDLLKFIDYLIIDFKHFDSQSHEAWIGVPNETTRENLKYIFSIKRQVLVRILLVNGFNIDAHGFVNWFKQFDLSNAQFEILTYHEYGKDKWQMPYQIENGFVSGADFDLFKQYMIENNFNLITT